MILFENEQFGRQAIKLLNRTKLLVKAMERPEDTRIVFLAVSDKISAENSRFLSQEKEAASMKVNEENVRKKVISHTLRTN
jgi:hypothetical protein